MQTGSVLEYKCPCCGASLSFGADVQKMDCEYCGTTLEIDAVKAYSESLVTEEAQEEFTWTEEQGACFSESEQENVRSFVCPACGGEIMTDANTAATFCPYCENPTILPGRVSQQLKPDAVLPFKKTKEDAKAAFLALCKGKPLLPKMFTQEHRLEKITGIYVPFWLYNCGASFQGSYKGTRSHSWSDSKYHYTRTEHYLLNRASNARFRLIPMDASKKMDDAIMESIEPFDFSQMADFEMAYLSGYFADKYDVESEAGKGRVKERVSATMNEQLAYSFSGYSGVIPTSQQLSVEHTEAKYVLLPVWMLHTRYQDKTYVFAMNGQTGKMTGTFPICPKRSAAWFSGIFAGVGIAAALLQLLFL